MPFPPEISKLSLAPEMLRFCSSVLMVVASHQTMFPAGLAARTSPVTPGLPSMSIKEPEM